MELRIVGNELELAEFLKALGTGNVMAKAIMVEDTKPKKAVVKPKKSVSKAKKYVDTRYLANKYGITTQAIRNYAKAGMPHKIVDKNYRYNEAEVSEWIDNYMATHKSKNRGIKYGARKKTVKTSPVFTKSIIKNVDDVSDYTKWRRNISAICKASGMDEGKLLSNTYKYMTKTYGIVWTQLNKDFYKTYHRKPVSTLEVAYALEKSSNVYTNLLEGCLDTVIKESK